jgi:hypothetical protein
MLLKSMPLDKLSVKELLLTIKNSSMKHKKDKSNVLIFIYKRTLNPIRQISLSR